MIFKRSLNYYDLKITMNTNVTIKKAIYFTWKYTVRAIFTKNDDVIKI